MCGCDDSQKIQKSFITHLELQSWRRNYSKAAMYEPMNTDPRGYMQMGIIVVGGVIRQVSMVKGKYISCNEGQKNSNFFYAFDLFK